MGFHMLVVLAFVIKGWAGLHKKPCKIWNVTMVFKLFFFTVVKHHKKLENAKIQMWRAGRGPYSTYESTY